MRFLEVITQASNFGGLGVRTTLSLYTGRQMPNLRHRFSNLTFRSQYCGHRFRITPKKLFRPLKPLKSIFAPDQSSNFNLEYLRMERMSYKNISICLSDLNSFNLVHQFPKKSLISNNSMKSDVSHPPAHQVRVAKSAMVFQSIESTKMKLSHLSPSIQRLRRVGTRDLPQFSSPQSVSATQSWSTKPLKLPPLPPLSDFRNPQVQKPCEYC